MCPGSTVPLGTLRNGHFRAFPAFPAFPGFSTDSGGPTLPLRSLFAGTAKSLRITTLRLFDPGWPSGHPGHPGQSPYSWPPELTRTASLLAGLDSRPAYCSLCQKCRFCSFLFFLKEKSKKREAARYFRPAYCSVVFQIGRFLDGFSRLFRVFSCFPRLDPRTL